MKLLYFFLISFIFTQKSIGFSDNNTIKSILEYRVPDYAYKSFTVKSDMNFGHIEEEKLGIGVLENQKAVTKWENYRIKLLPSFFVINESEKLNFSYGFKTSLEQSLDETEFKPMNKTTYDKIRSLRRKNVVAESYINYNKYSDYNFVSRISFLGFYRENKYLNSNIHIDRTLSANLSLGTGVGRVRNISHVLRAMRFAERIKTLKRPVLSDNNILVLASLIARKGAYESLYDRDAKYFWEEAEKLLPNLFRDMNAFDIFYLVDAMSETLGNRREGLEYELAAKFNHSRSNNNKAFNYENNRYGINSAIRYSKNINLDQQVATYLNLGYFREKLYLVEEAGLLNISFNLDYLYVLADNLLQNIGINGVYEKTFVNDDKQSGRELRELSPYMNLNLFFEDKFSLNLSLRYQLNYQERQNERNYSNFSAVFGLTYYLDRNFR